jgi:hypothetical protein
MNHGKDQHPLAIPSVVNVVDSLLVSSPLALDPCLTVPLLIRSATIRYSGADASE